MKGTEFCETLNSLGLSVREHCALGRDVTLRPWNNVGIRAKRHRRGHLVPPPRPVVEVRHGRGSRPDAKPSNVTRPFWTNQPWQGDLNQMASDDRGGSFLVGADGVIELSRVSIDQRHGAQILTNTCFTEHSTALEGEIWNAMR